MITWFFTQSSQTALHCPALFSIRFFFTNQDKIDKIEPSGGGGGGVGELPYKNGGGACRKFSKNIPKRYYYLVLWAWLKFVGGTNFRTTHIFCHIFRLMPKRYSDNSNGSYVSFSNLSMRSTSLQIVTNKRYHENPPPPRASFLYGNPPRGQTPLIRAPLGLKCVRSN